MSDISPDLASARKGKRKLIHGLGTHSPQNWSRDSRRRGSHTLSHLSKESSGEARVGAYWGKEGPTGGRKSLLGEGAPPRPKWMLLGWASIMAWAGLLGGAGVKMLGLGIPGPWFTGCLTLDQDLLPQLQCPQRTHTRHSANTMIHSGSYTLWSDRIYPVEAAL